MTRMRVKIVVMGGLVLGLLLISPFAFNRYESSPRFWPRDPFDSNRWQQTPRNERYRVVNDLLRTHNPVGTSRAELESLLGKPDSEAPDRTFVTYEVKDGENERFTLNSVYFMRVWIDARGKVTQVNIGAD